MKNLKQVRQDQNPREHLAAIKIPYFPGCTLKTTAKNFEGSALEAARRLGIELVELPNWNCCGVVASLTSDDLMHHLAPVRNLGRIAEMNEQDIIKDEYRLLTLCAMCYNTLQRANLRVRENAEDLQKINDFMYLEPNYDGNVDVIHFLELLSEIGFEKVRQQIANPLADLKIASYYGCTLLRPKDVGIDDPESPTIMEEFVEALGAQAVQWRAKSRCCGSYHTVNHKEVVVNLAQGIIENARAAGAEAIITSCPLCAFNLDQRQEEVQEAYPDFQPMPVFYFSQLLALALGVEDNLLGWDKHYVDPLPLLRAKTVIRDA
jgi:heterodisulfide reductase subunit B